MLNMIVCAAMGMGGNVSVESLEFMSGDWVAETASGTFEESWSKPAGGTMVGHGRLLREGKTSFMEFLSIETDPKGAIRMFIVLGALSQGDKKPAEFLLAEVGKDSATFTRTKDDFPKSIRYKRTPRGLECLLTGPGDTPKRELYDFERPEVR